MVSSSDTKDEGITTFAGRFLGLYLALNKHCFPLFLVVNVASYWAQ